MAEFLGPGRGWAVYQPIFVNNDGEPQPITYLVWFYA